MIKIELPKLIMKELSQLARELIDKHRRGKIKLVFRRATHTSSTRFVLQVFRLDDDQLYIYIYKNYIETNKNCRDYDKIAWELYLIISPQKQHTGILFNDRQMALQSK